MAQTGSDNCVARIVTGVDAFTKATDSWSTSYTLAAAAAGAPTAVKVGTGKTGDKMEDALATTGQTDLTSKYTAGTHTDAKLQTQTIKFTGVANADLDTAAAGLGKGWASVHCATAARDWKAAAGLAATSYKYALSTKTTATGCSYVKTKIDAASAAAAAASTSETTTISLLALSGLAAFW